MTFLKDQGHQMPGRDIRHKGAIFDDKSDLRSSLPPSYPPNSSPTTSRSTSPAPSLDPDLKYDHGEGPRKQFRASEEEPQPPLLLPSEYLCACCPLCFGGAYPDSGHAMEFVKLSLKLNIITDLFVLYRSDAIVCIDTCFTQKHNKTKSARDPSSEHPDTVFVLEADVKGMEDFVDSVQGTNVTQETDHEDGYEPGLRAPRSALKWS
ncbi:hypothetical protein V5O48_018352 [Marasmius crinis-equi]|uniref:Uncharacterized protein n=1 Tax=Marasmius crinis-equi TaxID=585013 RepID=A0ABR3ELF7_9AGAR